MSTTATVIRTAYASYPGSNVGKVVATADGRQVSTRWNQALNSDANHRRAAERFALIHGGTVGEEVHSNDSGTRRRFTATPTTD